MAGKITNFLREGQFGFSIILTIVGIIVLYMGITGIWYQDFCILSVDLLDWSLYLLFIGFIVFAFGIYYLYAFYKNRKFIIEELKTNKRSEFLKKHAELKITVKRMPSKYRKMVKDKEEELKIK